jgi:phosphatidylserine decarboxylase
MDDLQEQALNINDLYCFFKKDKSKNNIEIFECNNKSIKFINFKNKNDFVTLKINQNYRIFFYNIYYSTTSVFEFCIDNTESISLINI